MIAGKLFEELWNLLKEFNEPLAWTTLFLLAISPKYGFGLERILRWKVSDKVSQEIEVIQSEINVTKDIKRLSSLEDIRSSLYFLKRTEIKAPVNAIKKYQEMWNIAGVDWGLIRDAQLFIKFNKDSESLSIHFGFLDKILALIYFAATFTIGLIWFVSVAGFLLGVTLIILYLGAPEIDPQIIPMTIIMFFMSVGLFPFFLLFAMACRAMNASWTLQNLTGNIYCPPGIVENGVSTLHRGIQIVSSLIQQIMQEIFSLLTRAKSIVLSVIRAVISRIIALGAWIWSLINVRMGRS